MIVIIVTITCDVTGGLPASAAELPGAPERDPAPAIGGGGMVQAAKAAPGGRAEEEETNCRGGAEARRPEN